MFICSSPAVFKKERPASSDVYYHTLCIACAFLGLCYAIEKFSRIFTLPQLTLHFNC